MKKSLFFAAVFLSACLSTGSAREWTQWRGPDQKMHCPEQGILKNWETHPPKHLWTADGFGAGYSSLSITDDHMYTTGNLDDAQALIAADRETGNVLWSTPISQNVPKHGYEGARSMPAVDGDRLYVVSSDGAIHCIGPDGKTQWKHGFKETWKGKMMSGWGFSESPLVDGDWVLCTPGGKEAMIVALDKKSGKEIWRSAVPDLGENGKDGAGYSSIVISEAAGVKQYVQLVGRGVIGVRASDGRFLWGYNRVANKTANIPTPIISGNYVFCSTGYGTGSALLELSSDNDGVNVTEKYFLEGKTLQNHHGGMVLVGSHLYLGNKHNSGFPVCVEMKTGEFAWGGKERGPGKGSACVLYADGHIIFRYQDGLMALVEATPDAYKLKGTWQPDYQKGKTWAHPVIVDGKLYLREQNKVMCYQL